MSGIVQAANVAHVVLVRCTFCSKHRAEWRIHRLASGQTICDYCFAWHSHALDFLGGAPPHGCQQCERSFADLRAEPGIATSLFVVKKDGVYQLLCSRCVKPYAAKRSDLYGNTQFGKDLIQ